MESLRQVAAPHRVLFFLGVMLLASSTYALVVGTRPPDEIASIDKIVMILRGENGSASAEKAASLLSAQDQLIRKLNSIARTGAKLMAFSGILALLLAWRVRRESSGGARLSPGEQQAGVHGENDERRS
jgi:hypothetical protein